MTDRRPSDPRPGAERVAAPGWHRRFATPLAACELLTGAALAAAARSLPAHDALTDAPLVVVAVTLLLGGALTIRLRAGHERRTWRAARGVAATALVAGLIALSLLAITATGLSAIFGPLSGGALAVVGILAALLAAYGVALPALKLAWLASAAHGRAPQ